MNYKVEKKKRRRRFPLRTLIVLILLLAILGGGMKLGFIPGGQHIFGKDGIYPKEQTPPPPAPPQDIVIVVAEEKILIKEAEVTPEALEKLIKEARPEDSFQVKDQQAIKSAFELVTNLLKKYNRTFNLIE